MYIILFLTTTDRLITTMVYILPVMNLGLEKVISNSLQVAEVEFRLRSLTPEPQIAHIPFNEFKSIYII